MSSEIILVGFEKYNFTTSLGVPVFIGIENIKIGSESISTAHVVIGDRSSSNRNPNRLAALAGALGSSNLLREANLFIAGSAQVEAQEAPVERAA